MDNCLHICADTSRQIWKILERNLKIVSVSLGVLVLTLFIAFIVNSSEKEKYASRYNDANLQLQKEKEKVCYTAQCIEKAYSILENMNASADPCEDFHKFACTNLVDDVNIPDGEAWATSFTTVKERFYNEIREMLELEEHLNSSEIKPLRLAKRYYKTCINIQGIDDDGLKTIKRILDSLGGWPVLEGSKWNETKFDWKKTMYVLRNGGYEANYLLSVDIMTDLENASRRIITIDEGVVELFAELLHLGLENKFKETYLRFMVDVAVLFGANETLAKEELLYVYLFERALANILPEYQYHITNKSNLYNPVTVAELQNIYTITNWKEYLTYILNLPNFQLLDNDVVNVRVPKYLHDLEELLFIIPKRTTANYIMWRVVMTSMPYLSTRLRHLNINFADSVTKSRTSLPDWKRCTVETLNRFWDPLKTIYGRKHFHKKSEEFATEMLQRITNEFIDVLKNTEWMDKETKRYALEKAHSYNFYISSFEFMSNEQLNQYYSELDFTTTNYLKNTLEISFFTLNNKFRSLQKPVYDKPTQVDITKERNLFTDLPGGLFHEDLFHTNLPYYINYGSIGYWMGHTIAHSFDARGKYADKYGRLHNWWTDRTEIHFENKANCLIRKFSNYTVAEIGQPLNSRKTLAENLADSAGIKTAYLAYNRWIEENGIEQQLPGLNYTVKQMFWISLANLYCSKYRPFMLYVVNSVNNYILCKYRIIGSFSDSKYFANDFNCPIGSPMNPEVKCNVW